MKESTKDGLDRFMNDGCPVGDFLTAVLSNDLKGAFMWGDYQNTEDLREIVGYVYNELPAACQGSREKMKAWIEQGGLKGLSAAAEVG